MTRRYKHQASQEQMKKSLTWILPVSAAAVIVIILVSFFSVSQPPVQPEQQGQPPVNDVTVPPDYKVIDFNKFSPNVDLCATYSTLFTSSGSGITFKTWTWTGMGNNQTLSQAAYSGGGFVYIHLPVVGEIGQTVTMNFLWMVKEWTTIIRVFSTASTPVAVIAQRAGMIFAYYPSNTQENITQITSSATMVSVSVSCINSTHCKITVASSTFTKSIIMPKYYMYDKTPNLKMISLYSAQATTAGFRLKSISTTWESDIGKIVYV